MRFIVWRKPGGGPVLVTAPVISWDDPPGFTEAMAEQRAMKALPADAVGAHFVERAEFTADPAFRAAWTKTPGQPFAVDMAQAREIQKDRIRAERAPLLAALDVAYQRADEAGDAQAKADIAAQKDALRDATDSPLLEAAATPADLKAVTLDRIAPTEARPGKTVTTKG